MLKKIILVLVVVVVLGGMFYAGYKNGFDKGMSTAAQNFAKAKREIVQASAPKPTGPNTESLLRIVTGKWQSVTDEKLVREFTASSTITDYRGGKKYATGIITIFSSVSADPEATFKLDNGAAYIKIRQTIGEDTNTQFFKIQKITATDLELVQVDTKETVSFVRTK